MPSRILRRPVLQECTWKHARVNNMLSVVVSYEECIIIYRSYVLRTCSSVANDSDDVRTRVGHGQYICVGNVM